MLQISVIVPTHNPHQGRWCATLNGLLKQTLPPEAWELIVVDNHSSPPLPDPIAPALPRGLRSVVIREDHLGLTAARVAGFRSAQSPLLVLVDDDNVLAPDYLEHVIDAFERHPRVGIIGGRSLPEFERAPENWHASYFPLLAIRDLGSAAVISSGLRRPGEPFNQYPPFAPIGAGMALRRAAADAWLEWRSRATVPISDRRGTELTSGGDNDIVLAAMRSGWEVAYIPELKLTHLIPSSRLEPEYLARLNRGIQQSWMRVLRAHDACPWPPLTRLGANLRKAKAWLTHQPWRSSARRIAWQGVCGHFDGRIPS